MKKLIVLFIVVSTFTSCGLTSKLKLEDITVSEDQLSNQINDAIPELLNQQWLSTYLVQNETRPVVICASVINETSSTLSKDVIFNAIDLSLASTGKIRVLKSTKAQQELISKELLESQNIKFVITLKIVPNLNKKAAECIYSVWEKENEKPVGSISKLIRIGEI